MFNKRELPTKVASAVGTDHLGYRLVAGLVKNYGPRSVLASGCQGRGTSGPFPDGPGVRAGGSPDLRLRPGPKDSGYVAFQPGPDHLPRGLWAQRRQFADAVPPAKPLHSLAKNFVKVAAETAGELVGQSIDYHLIDRAFQRMTRRIVLGEHAADDTG